MQSAGGSHAQRDVFERITIDAGIRAGHYAKSAGLLRERLARRAHKSDLYTATRMEAIRSAQRIPAQ
jgi:hypothetical protein